MSKSLYFIAIIPPTEVCEQVQVFRKIMADEYGSSHALRSPPHITLIPPFYWDDDRYEHLKLNLASWSRPRDSFEIELLNFSCFKPRVIYVDVLPSSDLSTLEMDLRTHLKDQWDIHARYHKDFHPHLTIAFKDLKVNLFYHAWNYFQKEQYRATFLVSEINVLKYQDQMWHAKTQLMLRNKENESPKNA